MGHAETVVAVGEGTTGPSYLDIYNADESDHEQLICQLGIKNIDLFVESKASIANEEMLRTEKLNGPIKWLYPNGFDPQRCLKICILAAINESCNNWNDLIQSLNPSSVHTIKSHNILCEVDGEKGILKNIISESELNNSYIVMTAPLHIICSK